MTLLTTIQARRGRVALGSGAPISRRLAGLASLGAAALALGAMPAAAIAKVTPAFATNSSPSTSVGMQIFDHTNLTGGSSPTGTISFRLFAPGDTSCQSSVFNATVGVSGSGSDNSPGYATPAAGTYNWIATYNGDAANNPVASVCGGASQSVIINKVGPVATVTPALRGTAIYATAALKYGFAPLTGTLTFTVNGPADQFCSGAVLYTQTVAVNGAGSYDSGSFTPTAAGTYTYRIRYSGDTNNYGIGPTGCTTQGDSITVSAGQLAPPGSAPPPSGSPPPPSGSPPPTGSPPPSGGTPPPGNPGQPSNPAPPANTGQPTSPKSTGNPGADSPAAASGQSPTSQPTAGGPAFGQAGLTRTGTASVTPVFGTPQRCVRGPFRVYVTGRDVSGVTYYLGAKRLRKVTRADSRNRFVATVDPFGLRRRSTHTLTARITSSGVRRVLHSSFAICG